MKLKMSDFYGLPTGILENKNIRLEYLISCGPRIVRFSGISGLNLLAEVPEFNVQTTRGVYNFRGGHRLWCSPEIMPDTYSPDNEGLVVEKSEKGVRLRQNTETGIAKDLEIQLSPDGAAVTLIHQISNSGSVSVKLSPWAITMFRLGGTAILPQPVGNSDPQGLLNNRVMAFWPYTHINDHRLLLRDDFILIKAKPGLPPVKIGYFNPMGWMAYLLGGTLFRKTFEVNRGENFPDGGCNAEVFSSDKFVELESLGPLKILEPGSGTSLVERWELFNSLNVQFIPPEIREEINS
jgi:hypothetical protein